MVTTYETTIFNRGCDSADVVRLSPVPKEISEVQVTPVQNNEAQEVRVEQGSEHYTAILRVCSTCKRVKRVGPHVKRVYIPVSCCDYCVESWHSQSAEEDLPPDEQFKSETELFASLYEAGQKSGTIVTDTASLSWGNPIYNLNPLTEKSRDDVRRVHENITNWLYHGKYHGKSFLGTYVRVPLVIEPHLNLLEDVALLLYQIFESDDAGQRIAAIYAFCKLRGSRLNMAAMLVSVFSNIAYDVGVEVSRRDKYWKEMRAHVESKIDMAPQADEEFDFHANNPFRKIRQVFNNWERVKESPIVHKLHKFGLYILTLGLLDKCKITFGNLNYSKYEEKVIRNTHRPGLSMIECFLDTALFVCERGYHYFMTGDPNVLLHSGSSYEMWMATAQRLVKESQFLHNPEPHGVNKFKFLNELKDNIEKGEGIVKFTAKLEKAEKMMLQKLLNDLKLIEADQLTKSEAQRPRKDPFGVLLHGASKICKSQLTQIMIYHYAKVFGLPPGPEYIYTRCPKDEFWSGFNSTQWCIIMDDIAFMKPGMEMDPSLIEMLQVKNSVPYVPPQAELSDKGRTPVRPELVLATTNTLHLNLNSYFACPYAVARRLGYVITAKVKPQYSEYTTCVDSSKIPAITDGEYMNIWDFTIMVAIPATDKHVDAQQTKYKVVKECDDIHDMLQWYCEMGKKHEEAQSKALAASTVMMANGVCKNCFLVTQRCRCHPDNTISGMLSPLITQKFKTQAGDEEDDIPVVWDDSLPIDYDALDTTTPCNLVANDTINHSIPIVEVDATGQVVFEPVDISNVSQTVQMRDVTRLKFWIITKIVSHEVNELPYELDILLYWEAMNAVKYCFFVPFLWYNWWSFIMYSFAIVGFVFLYKYVWVILATYIEWKHGSFWKLKLLAKVCANEASAWKILFRCAGNRVANQIRANTRHLKILAGVLGAVGAAGILYRIFGRQKWTKHAASDGVKPTPGDEKPVFYYHDPYVVTETDVSSQSKCATPGTLDRMVRGNMAKFRFIYRDRGVRRSTSALNIHGNVWVFNLHSMKKEYDCELTVIQDPTTQNVGRIFRDIKITERDLIFDKKNDLAFIVLRSVQPGKSLLNYLPKDDILGGCHSGTYQMIDTNGIRSSRIVKNVYKCCCPLFNVPGYFGTVDEPTVEGDCGSVLVASVAGAQVILGLHAGGAGHKVVLHHLSLARVKECIKVDDYISKGTIFIDEPGYERKLISVHDKAAVRFVPQGTGHVIGSFAGYRPQMKSRVRPTYICNFVRDQYPAQFGPPPMGWQPWSKAITDMTSPSFSFDNQTLKECALGYLIDIRRAIPDLSMLEVYDLDTALNGADGVTYVDKINSNTSAGLPFRGSKKRFLEIEDGKITHVDDCIIKRMQEITRIYSKGERFHALFCGHLKDGPLELKKILAFKTRVFTGGEFAWSIVVRRYFLSHVRLIQNNPFVFEAMPGIVAQSEQWHELYDYLTKFGKNRIIAGDYGKYDKNMAASFILAAFDILIELSKKAGWNDDDLRIMRGIAYDTAFPTMDFHGDLVEMQGNPSGHPLTVIINCIVNSLYMRYAFVTITKRSAASFKQFVSLATYGDDNAMSVSRECNAFNHTAVAAVMASIGVEYTMADKESKSVPFIDVDQISFLKRTFRWDDEMKSYMAVLEEKSINKMLTSYVHTGVLAPEAHSICAIETAIREYFFYGRKKCEERTQYLKDVVTRAGLQDWVRESTFPEYDQMAIDFWKRHITDDNAEVAEERIQYFTSLLGVNRHNHLDGLIPLPEFHTDS